MNRTKRWLAGVMWAGVVVFAGQQAWAKRPPPADVPPVVSGAMRFEVPHFTTPCDSKQNGGCVVAYDNRSNAQVWALKIYCTKYDPRLEQDVQDVFITSLSVDASNRLQVSNEAGQHFTIDPATRQVTGDATGCSDGSSSGCNATGARSEAPTCLLLVAMGLVGILGARRWCAVRSRRQKWASPEVKEGDGRHFCRE